MIYVFVGLCAVFAYFVLWALVKANSFKGLAKEKAVATPIVNDEQYVVLKEDKPKKVKIKKKEEKVQGEAQIVKVFENEDKPSEVRTDYSEEKEKDELLQRYLNDEENLKNGNGSVVNGSSQATQSEDDFDKEIERRIAEIRRKSQADDNFVGSLSAKEAETNASRTGEVEPNYYGFGVGLSKHNHGSMKDPNFNPWPDEENLIYREAESTPFRSSFDDGLGDVSSLFDDDIFKGDFNQTFNSSDIPKFNEAGMFIGNPGLRTSRLGGGSVKGQVVGRTRPSAESMIVGNAINNRRFSGSDIADGDFDGIIGDAFN